MSTLNAINTVLFQWMTAGMEPPAPLLTVARGFALWGAWLSAGVLCGAGWRRPVDVPYLCIVAAAAGVASLLSHTIAASLNWPRPFMLGLAPPWIDHGGSGSLPSTHATVMFVIALALLRRPSLRMPGLALLALAAVTGWARVYVGVHFPLDIVAGFVLALAVAAGFAAGLWLLQEDLRRNGADAQASLWRRS